MQITAVTTMRDEGPFILEWLSYLRGIGVTHLVVFSNDCSDGTDTLLDLVAQDGWLTHVPHTVPQGKSPQWLALKAAWDLPQVRDADWVTVLDVDEFPDIVGGGGLSDVIASCPGADAIAMPWRLFGNSGIVPFRDTPVTAQFTRCAAPDTQFPVATTFFKSVFRVQGPFSGLGVHRPKQKNPNRHGHPVWVDGAGQTLPDVFAQNPKRLSLAGPAVGRSLVDLRHYSVRSVEAFLAKQQRGLPNRSSKPIDLRYWVRRNMNSHQAQPLKVASLDWSPAVLAAHAAAVAAHRTKIEAAKQTQDGYDLFVDLILAGQSVELSTAAAHHLYRMYQSSVIGSQDVT